MPEYSNEFARDALLHFRRCFELWGRLDSTDVVADCVQELSFGVEKYAKHVLSKTNPAFVYRTASFGVLLRLLYQDKCVASYEAACQGTADARDEHTIQMSEALKRGRCLSRPIRDHYDELRKLAAMRNVLLHKSRSRVNFVEARTILQATFHPFLEAIALELRLSVPGLLQGTAPSYEFTDDTTGLTVEEVVRRKLAHHQALWERFSNDPLQAERIFWLRSRYNARMSHPHLDCPACGNIATFRTDADIDENGDGYVYATGISCSYCGLAIETDKEIAFLGLAERFDELYPQ